MKKVLRRNHSPIMPLYEFLRLAIEKLESSQQKQCSTDLSLETENDLVGGLTMNGENTTKEQTDKVTRSPILHGLPPDVPTPYGDATLGNSSTSRTEKFGGVEYIFNDISPPLDLSHKDATVPWLSFPVDDSQQDYSSGVLPQTLSVSDKKLMGGNIFMSRQNGSSSGQTVSDLDDGQDAVKLSFSKANLLYPWLQQKDQASDPSLLNGSFSLFSNDKGNCQDTVFGNNANGRDLASDSSSMMDSPNAALPVVSCNKRMDVEEIVSAPRYSTPVKPILIDKLNVVQKDLDSYVSVVPTAFNSRQLLAKEPKEVFLDGMPKNISLDTFLKTDKCLVQNNGAYPVRALDGERTIESTIASSPLSSGNSADDMLSYEEKNKTERKFCDIEESECQSDELQNASVGVKKSSPAKGGGRGTKRRRAAEVHNLSERRRRDRINQKMLALQELIPNCNKADKASMLDEAIEYLKTLKHQVHIMSMGSGYCVPPMMFQPGTQHMYHAPILHFSLMRVRMGISPSYGNTDAGSPHCPIFPAPPIQGSYFPTSPLGLMNMQGPILPMHGHPNPVHHRTLRGPHLVPLAGWHQTPTHYQVPKMFSSEDVIMNKNSHGVFNVEASRSMQCPSSQVEARTDVPSADGVKTRGAAENRGGMK